MEIEDFGTNKIDWLRKYHPFDCDIPTRYSLASIIKGTEIEPPVLSLFPRVNATQQAAGQPINAIDGKTLRDTVNQRDAGNALHLVSAFDNDVAASRSCKACAAPGSLIISAFSFAEPGLSAF